MFISALDLFSIGIGPSSSHTTGPMVAACDFSKRIGECPDAVSGEGSRLRCRLKGSLAFTGRGHRTDWGVTFGLHGFAPEDVAVLSVEDTYAGLKAAGRVTIRDLQFAFDPENDIVFDTLDPLPEHPNGMIFQLVSDKGDVLLEETYFSIGGGFVQTLAEIREASGSATMDLAAECPYGFASASEMLAMCADSGQSIAEMKMADETTFRSVEEIHGRLDAIWHAMKSCVENGLQAEGVLPGGLEVARRARKLHDSLIESPDGADVNDWLCAYAMAVNEENASGRLVVTAPTNGAAGVIPAVLYHYMKHEQGHPEDSRAFLLTAGAIGTLVKHTSSISGAEVGCQGEVGTAAAMAAAGLCAVKGGTPEQIENAAEIALEHHLGMACDPVKGLVQVPCIERNGFGAIKAHAAASLARRGDGSHFMPLDSCIQAMKEIGEDMSQKFKETALGGLAVTYPEC